MRSVSMPGALVLAGTLGVAAAGTGATAGRVVRVEAPKRTEVRIPAGWFNMGVDPEAAFSAFSACKRAFPSASLPNGQANFCDLYNEDLGFMEPRQVYLDAYAIDRLEVGVSDYRACVAAGACELDPLISGDERYIRDEWPMVNITWHEAQTYCRWRGGRLPTEAEWERAARGDDPANIWPWGEREQLEDFNHGQQRHDAMKEIERNPPLVPLQYFGDPDDTDGHALLAPRGSYVWGESPFGTLDQAGNVAEWTADVYEFGTRARGYQELPTINPVRESSSTTAQRVVRGGSWRQPAFLARSNLRDPFNNPGLPGSALYQADRRFSHVGFRCARTVGRARR